MVVLDLNPRLAARRLSGRPGFDPTALWSEAIRAATIVPGRSWLFGLIILEASLAASTAYMSALQSGTAEW